MSTKLAEAFVGVTVDLRSMNRGMQQGQQMLRTGVHSMQGSLNRLHGSLRGMLGPASAIGAAIAGLGITAGLRGMIGLANSAEQVKMKMNVFLKDAERTNTLLREIDQFAKTTPFEVGELHQSAQQLIGAKVAAEDIVGIMRQLGDVASGSGARMSEMVYLYKQMKANGRLMMQDVYQFGNRGIPILEEFADMMGKSTVEARQMVSQGKLTFGMFEKLLARMTGEGGAYNNMMEKLSSTLEGRWSNLQDSIKGGLLKPLGQAIVEGLQLHDVVSSFTAKVERFSGAIVNVVKGLLQWNKQTNGLVVKIAGVVALVLTLIPMMSVAGMAASTFMAGMSSAAAIASTVFSALVGVVGAILSPVGLLVIAFVALGVAIYKLWRNGSLDGIIRLMQNLIGTQWESLKAFAEWSGVTSYLTSVFSGLKDIGTYLSSVFTPMIEGIKDTFGTTWDGVIDALTTGDLESAGEIAMLGLKATWAEVVSGMTTIWEDFKLALIEAFSGAAITIYKMWTDTQNKISKSIMDWANQEGVIGDAARKILGVDPRGQDEGNRNKMIRGTMEAQRLLRAQAAKYEREGNTEAAKETRERLDKVMTRLDQLRSGVDPSTGQDMATFQEEMAAVVDDMTKEQQDKVNKYWTELVKTAKEDADRKKDDANRKKDDVKNELADKAKTEREDAALAGLASVIEGAKGSKAKEDQESGAPQRKSSPFMGFAALNRQIQEAMSGVDVQEQIRDINQQQLDSAKLSEATLRRIEWQNKLRNEPSDAAPAPPPSLAVASGPASSAPPRVSMPGSFRR